MEKLLGTEDLIDFAEKYDLSPNSMSGNFYEHDYKKKSFKSVITDENKRLMKDDAIDLLEHLLVYDPEDRYSIIDALSHPYFDKVR